MADEKSYRPVKDAEGLVIDVTVEHVLPEKEQAARIKKDGADAGGALGVETVTVGKGSLSWPVDESTLREKGVLDAVAGHPLTTDKAESGGGSAQAASSRGAGGEK